jgi:peptidoglycan/xylan/chitin deacetylase (PgdA/CDA1 family)
MHSLFVKIPKWLQKKFPRLVWRVATSQKEIYLTFDDGPTPKVTQWVLQELEKYEAKATFFCIGKNTKAHPEIVKELKKRGHSIGNHTCNHVNGWHASTQSYIEEIEQTQKIFDETMGSSSFLFRPPYGKIKPAQAKALIQKGFQIVMWEVLSADFDKKTSPEKSFQNVLKNTTSGSIVVFHDSVKASRNLQHALPKVLHHFSEKGFAFKSLPVD